jgi:DNA-binding GntR family transcriptional regulator
MRSLLEGLCAKWAVEHLTEKQLGELEEIVYLSEFHASKGHFEQLLELDNRFHEALYKASNSRTLKHVLSDFHHYVQRVRKASLLTKERAMKSIEEHKAIVDAIKAKDGELAQQLTNLHVINTAQNVIEHGLEELLNQ